MAEVERRRGRGLSLCAWLRELLVRALLMVVVVVAAGRHIWSELVTTCCAEKAFGGRK